MEIFFIIVAIILSFIGLIGSVLPALPGAPFNFLAILILYFIKPDSVGLYTLIVLGVLTLVAISVDYILPVIKAKKFGASKYGILGLIIGMVFGFITLSFPGMIIGAVFGAIFGELFSGKKPESALVSGLAAIWGVALATVVKFSISLAMTIYFFVKLLSVYIF